MLSMYNFISTNDALQGCHKCCQKFPPSLRLQPATHAALVGTTLYVIPREIPVKKAHGSWWQKEELHGSEICRGAKVIQKSAGFLVKEGLSCVVSRAATAPKTTQLSPSLTRKTY